MSLPPPPPPPPPMNFKLNRLSAIFLVNKSQSQNRASALSHFFEKKQGNQGDMWKIHVTRQFSRLATLRVTFSKNKKKTFLDMVIGSVCRISGLHRFS